MREASRALLFAEDGRVLAGVRVLDTWRSRARGLLGEDSLALDECVLLRPCRSVHTFRMRLPIDVASLDGDLAVLAVRECVRPGRLLANRRLLSTRAVLEAACGAFEGWGLAVGERLRLEAGA